MTDAYLSLAGGGKFLVQDELEARGLGIKHSKRRAELNTRVEERLLAEHVQAEARAREGYN